MHERWLYHLWMHVTWANRCLWLVVSWDGACQQCVFVIINLFCVTENDWLTCDSLCWQCRCNFGRGFERPKLSRKLFQNIKKRKNSLFVVKNGVWSVIFHKDVFLVHWNLCGYIVGHVLSIHLCAKNGTSFWVMALKVSNFTQRFANKFYIVIFLDFVCSSMALRVMVTEVQSFVLWNTSWVITSVLCKPCSITKNREVRYSLKFLERWSWSTSLKD